jgi:chitodextrinase
MTKRAIRLTVILCAAALLPSAPRADNPIVQTIYTTDPAPLVHDGRVYVYTGHDEDGSTWFTMRDWWVFSSADMVNWTAHGSPLSLSTFSWATMDAWAGQCIERTGKFYWYVPVRSANGAQHIGVAVSESGPTGPFRDALGHALVSNAEIDPTVFIDGDGQAYLYYGNPNLRYVRLNEDMISYSGSPVQVPLTPESFGVRSSTDRPTQYEEGPWLHERDGRYYMIFAAGPIPEHISYSTGPSATGPWTFGGVIMPTEGSSFTNHPAIIDFAGNSYFFYHNGALPGGGGFARSVAVESFTWAADGSIPTIHMTTAGPSAVGTLDPYGRVEAETIAWEHGVELEPCSSGCGIDVTQISNGDSIAVRAVDFGTGAASFQARVASNTSGGSIELRLDGDGGTLVGTCVVPRTGGWQTWATVSCKVTGATGTRDLHLVFTGGSGNLFNLDWWEFTTAAGADAQPPSAPSDLTSPARSASSVSLSWTGSTDDVGVIGYVVYRGTSPAVAVGATSTTSFEVTGLTPDTSYDFTVQALDAAANVSSSSAPLTVSTLADTTAPSTPANLVSSNVTSGGVTLAWGASTDDIAVTGYVLYGKVGSADRTQLGTVNGSTTIFNVTGLSPGTTYALSVEATDAAGNHSAPAQTTVTTVDDSSSGGGCGHGTPFGLALPVLALWLLFVRRRRA